MGDLRDRLRRLQGANGTVRPQGTAPPASDVALASAERADVVPVAADADSRADSADIPGARGPERDVAAVGGPADVLDSLSVMTDVLKAGSGAATRDPQITRAPDHLSAHRGPPGPEALLPGMVHMTPHGACYVAEWRYPLAHLHGHTPLGAAQAIAFAESTSLLTRGAAERTLIQATQPRRIVYLDTETTGLAGGTGTYAFLIGIGRFVGAEFVVRQLFMRTLGEEFAALHVLARELEACDVLVTYNGKAFDWPLIETRYTLARRGGPAPADAPGAHIDLLFSARRLWRARLTQCTLGRVEHALLGVRRTDDTPGWLIPQLYFAYLRDHDARPLTGVFRHNALDILSLAALLGRVAAVRLTAASPADELLALGRCFEEDGDLARALACFQAAAEGSGQLAGELRLVIVREARMRAGAVLKRLRRAHEAVEHWEAAVAAGRDSDMGGCDIRPYEELAKYCEHVLRDRDAARTYVRQALHALGAGGWRAAPQVRARLLHRLARLEQSIAARATS